MPVFQGLSNGLYNGKTVICDGGDRARTAGSVELDSLSPMIWLLRGWLSRFYFLIPAATQKRSRNQKFNTILIQYEKDN